MRIAWALTGIVLAVALTGCGGDDRTAWNGPPAPLPADGALPVDAFNDYLDAVEEPWERSAVGQATAYALPAARETTDLRAEFVTNDPDGNAIVSVTIATLDDSVRAVRFVLRFDVLGDSAYRLVDATWQQRCQVGRGHQSWSRELCL
jgi:hypothetical protein